MRRGDSGTQAEHHAKPEGAGCRRPVVSAQFSPTTRDRGESGKMKGGEGRIQHKAKHEHRLNVKKEKEKAEERSKPWETLQGPKLYNSRF